MKAGFKKIPWSLRTRLHELSGSEALVWLHALLYSGKDDQATLDNARIIRETGLSHNTVAKAKAGLRRKCWMTPTGGLVPTDEYALLTYKLGIPPPQNMVNQSTPKNGELPPPQYMGNQSTPNNGKLPPPQNLGSIVDTLGSGQKASRLVDTKAVGVEAGELVSLVSSFAVTADATTKTTSTPSYTEIPIEAVDGINFAVAVCFKNLRAASKTTISKMYQAHPGFVWDYEAIDQLKLLVTKTKSWSKSILSQDDLCFRWQSNGDTSLYAQLIRALGREDNPLGSSAQIYEDSLCPKCNFDVTLCSCQ